MHLSTTFAFFQQDLRFEYRSVRLRMCHLDARCASALARAHVRQTDTAALVRNRRIFRIALAARMRRLRRSSAQQNHALVQHIR